MSTIKFNEAYLSGNEMEYVSKVFENGHFQGNGLFTKRAQDYLSEMLCTPNVLLTDSCTSALEISALLLKQTDIDEVILPSYTFSSTASAFARAGYKIRFAEVDAVSMMLDVADVERLVNERTRAVVTVHYAGFPSSVESLKELCKRHHIDLVEDAAQALGTKINGKSLGTYGRLSCFSFHETKNIHCGLGGALVINDPKLVERATYIWERGTNRDAVLRGAADKYTWVEVGGSFYPTELQAAFLLAQLHSFEMNLCKRAEIFEQYSTQLMNLKSNGDLSFMIPKEGITINYHAFFVKFSSEGICEGVRKALLEDNIHAYIGYVPLHSSPVGLTMGYTPNSLPVTEKEAKCVLRLPFHNNLSPQDIKRVCSIIKEYFVG